MASTPPVKLPRPPDQLEKMHNHNTSKTQHDLSSDSSYNSSKLRREVAIQIAISEKELDWAKKFISMASSGEIRVQRNGEGDSQSKDLHNTHKSVKSTFPFTRNQEAISGRFIGESPQSCLQERGPIEEIRAANFNGDYSSVFVEHIAAISSNYNGETNGNDFASNLTGAPTNHENEKQREEECLENNNRNVQLRDVQRVPSKLNAETRVNLAEMHNEHRDERLVGRAEVSPVHNADDEIALNMAGRIESSHQNQVSEVSKYTNFSLKVDAGEYDQSHNMEEMQHALGPGRTSKTSLTNTNDKDKGKTQLHENANEYNAVYKGQVQVQTNGHPHRFNTQHLQHSNQVSQAKEKQQQPTSKSNVEQHQSGNGYPKVSSNFEPQIPNQRTRPVSKPIQDNEKQDLPNSIINKKEHIPEPAPYTVVQTYAARLRHNQSKIDKSIKLTTLEISTKQGLPAVLFIKEEFLGPLAETCKYTLIGKFTHTMPKVELIRKSFILQTQLSRGVKIAHYNARHVYIDLDNELDYNTVWTKQRMSIAGQLMRIQAWTPSFKPEVETTIVPVWVTLPDLPWPCYNKEFVAGLLIPVGKVLYLDSASIQKTRGSKAKVKVQIDLSKERPPHVWMGYKGDDLTDGRWQTIEYEEIPPYCFYCMHQGHMNYECSIKQKDEDQKRRREVEEQGKNKSGKETENKEQQHAPHRDQISRIRIANNRKQEAQKEAQQAQEEQWQTQKKKNNNQQPLQKEMHNQAEQPNNQDGNEPQQTKENAVTKLKTAAEDVSKNPKNQNPNVNYDCVVVEADGGMDEGSKEKPTDVQEEVTKGGNLTHVLHEGVHNDLSRDLRASATTLQSNVNAGHHIQEGHKEIQNQDPDNPHEKHADSIEKHDMNIRINNQTPKNKGTAGNEGTQNPTDIGDESGKKTPNNKSRGKRTASRTAAATKRIDTGQHCQDAEDEYVNIQSEDEFDQDTQSLNDQDEAEEETSIHLIKAFGSTMFQKEVEKVTGKGCLLEVRRGFMIETLCWNARSINSQGSLERLQTLKKMHNLSIIVILEPFSNNSHINTYKIQLNMEQAYCNNNGKIWLFWNSDMTCNILEAEDQQITCELKHVNCNANFHVTFICAKCKEHLRRPLWDKLIQYSNKGEPWCTIGDFNVITSTEEKLGAAIT
ncbi:hypothetical protein H5410_027322 [Solanum commersonii]|uniref:DUF4283 domain-containing protein n=1 Tax=Solanum commersonii TaxID=4109 RepID=A0A9J5Z445_SOLCO|nr:hypothetical protein H5410_027322 [Solanum commersonii]